MLRDQSFNNASSDRPTSTHNFAAKRLTKRHRIARATHIAVDAIASPFNDHGTVPHPAKTYARPQSEGSLIDAEIYAHPVEGKWFATSYWTVTGSVLLGDGLLPHRLFQQFDTETEAVEAAGQRLINQTQNALGELASQPDWANQLDSLRQFVAKTVKDVRAKDTSLPLRGTTVIDLCAGVGAMAMGFTSHGAEVTLACEIDKHAQAVYQKNLNPARMHGDVCTLDGRKLVCDILTIGMVCTAFSKAGKQLGFEDPTLVLVYQSLLRLMTEIHAKVVIIECAPELLTQGGGSAADTVHKTLMRAGYRVQHRTLDAVGFGVPQFRNRSFIVATRVGLPVDDVLGYVFPKAKTPTARVKDIIEPNVPGHIGAEEIVFKAPSKAAIKKRGTEVAAGRRMTVGYIGGSKSQGYRVMSIDGIGATMTATGGGRAPCTGAYLINGKARGLTPREACRMQGFPEWFEHDKSPRQALKQAGNAVAVPLIRELAHQLVGLLRPNS